MDFYRTDPIMVMERGGGKGPRGPPPRKTQESAKHPGRTAAARAKQETTRDTRTPTRQPGSPIGGRRPGQARNSRIPRRGGNPTRKRKSHRRGRPGFNDRWASRHATIEGRLRKVAETANRKHSQQPTASIASPGFATGRGTCLARFGPGVRETKGTCDEIDQKDRGRAVV